MTDAQPAKPKRSRRMVLWMVAVPVALLLLALAGANWKFFHLAYAKHLMGSTDSDKRYRGTEMVIETHIRKGMSLEEVRRLLAPTEITETENYLRGRLPSTFRHYAVGVEGRYILLLVFDEDDRLRSIGASIFGDELPIPWVSPPGK